MNILKIKNLLLDLFFPKFCLFCQKEGNYICEDCKAILEISGFHQKLKTNGLSDLYFVLDYKTPLIKKIIQKYKYPPFIKEIGKELALLIIDHFKLMNPPPPFLKDSSNFVLIPVPLEKRKLKWRGFNQTEEIAKELAKFLKIPLVSDCLIKTKRTPAQVELSEKEREKNLKDVFFVQKREKILGKKILLVDDVYTTGTTMAECAKVLKKAGAKEIIGVAIARASPDDDKIE